MAGLIFLWQQAAAVTPPPVIDVGIGLLDEAPAPAKRHRGRGHTTLEPVVGFGTGRARRRSVPGFVVIAPLGCDGDGAGRLRRSGSGHLTLGGIDPDGEGRRRRSGKGSLSLVLLRATDRDALLALAAHAVD